MRAPALLLLVLLAPVAAAAPLAGELDLLAPPRLAGDVALVATDGLLDLGAGLARAPLEVRFLRAHVERPWSEYQGTTLTENEVKTDGGAETADLTDGVLRVTACRPGCAAFLVARPGGRLAMEGRVDGEAPWIPQAEDRAIYTRGGPAEGAFYHAVPAGSLAAQASGGAARPGLVVRDARLNASGALLLALHNVTAVVEDASGTRTYDVGQRREPAGAAGLALPAAERTLQDLLLVAVDGAQLVAAEPSGARLVASALDARLRGALEAPHAVGTLRLGGATREVQDETLEARGDLALRLVANHSARLTVRGREWLPQSALAAGVEGEADGVRVGGRPFEPPVAIAPAAAAAGGAVVLLLALLLAWKVGALPLYSRIARSRVLAHPHRAALHAIIREAPGLTASELARREGVSRVVAQHHLSLLLAHAFVSARRTPTGIRYFLPEASPRPEELALAEALRDGTRRGLARLVATGAGVTQNDLVARTGLSQRLVAHHLQRLERDGLLLVVQGRPRRYLAAPALREALAEGGAPASGS